MPYFIVNASHHIPLPMPEEEINSILPAHQAHIARGLSDKLVLCAGPKTSGKGGFIIIKAKSRDELDTYIAEDPFCQQGIMDYEVTEFMPVDRQPYIEPWL